MFALLRKLSGRHRTNEVDDRAKPPKWMTETKAPVGHRREPPASQTATPMLVKEETWTQPTRPASPTITDDRKVRVAGTSGAIQSDELSHEQSRIFSTIEMSNEHWFITGRAGSGKSFLLRYLAANTEKSHMVVAPTGVAALNAGGMTIHSAFGLPPRFIDRHEVAETYNLSQAKKQVLKNVELLIIDEVSMVRADLMDGIDLVLRDVRRSDWPFGGVQVVAFGDLFQLPPIVDDKALADYFAHNLGGSHFFNAFVWRTAKLHVQELQSSFRQRDQEFLGILDSIRNGEVGEEQIRRLNSRLIDSDWRTEGGTVYLTGTNARADAINAKRLQALPGQTRVYVAEMTGASLGKSLPTDIRLALKPDAQVMMVRNDPSGAWVNGTIGTVTKLTDYYIGVEIDGIEHEVGIAIWEKYRYAYDPVIRRVTPTVIGSFQQYPIKLAWATTIHKSQGKTFDDVVVDLESGAFASGQVYVALSRSRTLDGLRLAKPLQPSDLIVDVLALEFMDLQRVPF